jgi:uncharacterized protein YbjT (DUF2867 family)
VVALACPGPLPAGVVEDVAAAFQGLAAWQFGKSYDLCGPRVYTLRELVDTSGR